MSRPVVLWPAPGATAREVVADLSVLEAAMAGTGPAVAVPGALADPAAVRVPDETAVVVATSGTTGRPKPALLTAEALHHAVRGVEGVFGGPGQWLLAVPPTHITGMAVVLRNLAAGHEPVAVAPGHFGPEPFVAATERLTGARRYVTLVPTQLRRLLPDPCAVDALRSFDVVLVGAAPLPAADRAAATAAGIRVVDGYGCSETAGGCLYDGVPLPGMQVRLGAEGRLHLGGPQVALGYLDRPDLPHAFTTDDAGVRWYRSDDHGTRGPDARVHVAGRLDDVINTGGLKVAPTAVEDAIGLAGVPGVAEVMVVGIPDPEWGQTVAALVVPTRGCGPDAAPPPALPDLRAALADHLPTHALPRRLQLVERLPVVGPGKPDRQRGRALLGLA